MFWVEDGFLYCKEDQEEGSFTLMKGVTFFAHEPVDPKKLEGFKAYVWGVVKLSEESQQEVVAFIKERLFVEVERMEVS